MERRHVAALLAGLAAAGAFAVAQPATERQRALPHYRMGMEHLRAEAWPEAERSFQQAVEIDPGFELAWFYLGRANMPQRKYPAAVAAFTRSRDLFRSQTGRQFANQHEAQRYRQDQITLIDEAIRQYQTGPQTPQAQEAQRQLQDQRRQVQLRVQRGANMAIDNAVPAFVSLALGSAHFRTGNLAEAEREYNAAIAVDPKAGEAHNNLAVVYLETGRLDEAEKAVNAAEKAGYKVHPQLKQDIKDRRKGGALTP
jgi:tetratricopeptide (TPR) repeat protein